MSTEAEFPRCPNCNKEVPPGGKAVKMTLKKKGLVRNFVFCSWAHMLSWAMSQGENLEDFKPSSN